MCRDKRYVHTLKAVKAGTCIIACLALTMFKVICLLILSFTSRSLYINELIRGDQKGTLK